MPSLKKTLFVAAVALGLSAGLSAQSKCAFISVVNEGGDPRYDYLEGMIAGILQYDLSSTDGLVLIDRSSVSDILKEQELTLALGDESAVKVGALLGADWLIKGGYTALGADLAINVKLIDVASGRSYVYADRGAGENLIHGIAERIVQKVTGKAVALRSDLTERSLLSLKDEKPGSINLHCNLIDAEIFMDGSFIGYTLGDIRKPFVIGDVTPGAHKLKVVLRGFGVWSLPEMVSKDWEAEVKVLPGKNTVVRTDAVHLGMKIQEIQEILDEEVKLTLEAGKDKADKTWDLSFVDRKGKKVSIILAATFARTKSEGSLKGTLTIDGKAYPVELSCATGKEVSDKKTYSLIRIDFDIDLRADYRSDYDVRVYRTDIDDILKRYGYLD